MIVLTVQDFLKRRGISPGRWVTQVFCTVLAIGSLLSGVLMPGEAHAGQVAVIESYDASYEWDEQYLRALNDDLSDEHTLTTYEMNTKKLDRADWPAKAQEILGKIKQSKPDVVIIGDDNALSSLGESIAALNIPIVFLGINGTEEQHPVIQHPNVTGIYDRPFFKKSIKHLSKVMKKKERFLILLDDSPSMNNSIIEWLGDKRQAEIRGTQVDVVLTSDKDTWMSAMMSASQSGYAAVIVGTYHTIHDSQGEYVDPDSLIREATLASDVPVFALWGVFVGAEKAVGGYTVSAYNEGKHAAKMADLILKGHSPSALKTIRSVSGEYVYSKSGMARWGLALSTLAASQARFVD